MSEQTRVDFYVLAEPDSGSRLRFACRLAEKVYHLGQRVHLHTDSASAAAELDQLLWTFRQGSFVPHEIAAPGEKIQSPVTIGHGGVGAADVHLLINLSGAVPDFADEIGRIAEIVDSSDNGRRLGRDRYRRYRDSGRKITTHNIGNAP